MRFRQATWPEPFVSLATYFVLAYAWTWSCWGSIYIAQRSGISLPFPRSRLETLGQFGPFLAAMIVSIASAGWPGLRELLSRLTRWQTKPIWILVSLLLLPATMLLAILMYAAWHGVLDTLHFGESWTTLPAHFVYLLLVGGPLGEEPGWRGFALPRLQVLFGPVLASIVLGVLWAVWHLPLWWIGLGPCPLWMYIVGVTCSSILFTWLFNHTNGSVFYSLIFHTSLSLASVRMPDVPAYHIWVICLFVIALVIVHFDRRLGEDITVSASMDRSGKK
jgi:uncharacterized protein